MTEPSDNLLRLADALSEPFERSEIARFFGLDQLRVNSICLLLVSQGKAITLMSPRGREIGELIVLVDTDPLKLAELFLSQETLARLG
jgi:hypothetical protein